MQVAHPRHRAGACTLNAVGLLPVSGRGDARVAPPCPTTLCVWRRLPYLTLQSAVTLPCAPRGPRAWSIACGIGPRGARERPTGERTVGVRRVSRHGTVLIRDRSIPLARFCVYGFHRVHSFWIGDQRPQVPLPPGASALLRSN